MFIKGKDLMFFMEIEGQYVALCHAKTCTINTTATTLPTTTYLSGKGETNDYSGKYAYTIKGDGFTYFGDIASNFTLQNAQVNFVKINWLFTDNENVQWNGIALITSTTFDSSFDAVSAFQNELTGDGEYTFVMADVPPIPPIGSAVTIIDQFGNVVAIVPAPGNYVVTKFDTIDLHFWNTVTNEPIVPQIIITQTI